MTTLVAEILAERSTDPECDDIGKGTHPRYSDIGKIADPGCSDIGILS